MVIASTGPRVEEIAQDLFEVVTQLGLSAQRPRRGLDDLKEVEYLTLSFLHNRGTMIVGDIQRLLGVLPAQMSRIIRALENRPTSFISCRINPRDKRKIDVELTETGTKSLLDYQAVRVHRLVELLHNLPEDDQEDLIRLLDKVKGLLEGGRGKSRS